MMLRQLEICRKVRNMSGLSILLGSLKIAPSEGDYGQRFVADGVLPAPIKWCFFR